MLKRGGEPLLLPTGTRCFVAEADGQGASQIVIQHHDYHTGAVVTGGDRTARLSLVVENVFDIDHWNEPNTPTGGNHSGELPYTGARLVGLLVPMDLAALLAGFGLVFAARRRRTDP